MSETILPPRPYLDGPDPRRVDMACIHGLPICDACWEHVTAMGALWKEIDRLRDELRNAKDALAGTQQALLEERETNRRMRNASESEAEIDRMRKELENYKTGLSRANELNQKMGAEFQKVINEKYALEREGHAPDLDKTVAKMRALGILAMRTRDLELTLGPEPVAHVEAQPEPAPVAPIEPGKLPPRNSPIWWSTPNYSATVESKEE